MHAEQCNLCRFLPTTEPHIGGVERVSVRVNFSSSRPFSKTLLVFKAPLVHPSALVGLSSLCSLRPFWCEAFIRPFLGKRKESERTGIEFQRSALLRFTSFVGFLWCRCLGSPVYRSLNFSLVVGTVTGTDNSQTVGSFD